MELGGWWNWGEDLALNELTQSAHSLPIFAHVGFSVSKGTYTILYWEQLDYRLINLE